MLAAARCLDGGQNKVSMAPLISCKDSFDFAEAVAMNDSDPTSNIIGADLDKVHSGTSGNLFKRIKHLTKIESDISAATTSNIFYLFLHCFKTWKLSFKSTHDLV